MYICTVVQVQSAFPRTSPNSKQWPRENQHHILPPRSKDQVFKIESHLLRGNGQPLNTGRNPTGVDE